MFGEEKGIPKMLKLKPLIFWFFFFIISTGNIKKYVPLNHLFLKKNKSTQLVLHNNLQRKILNSNFRHIIYDDFFKDLIF